MDDFDLPLEMFWAGSDEETAENHLKHLENAVIREVVQRFQAIDCKEASQHLQGCSRRLLMMQHARIEILATAKEEEKPLASHRLNLLNICLNSYYVNLLGALDNLAWAATYDLQLLLRVDESDWETRKFCSLSSAKFLASLSQRNEPLASFLSAQQEWIQDLRRFRDPAAHRIPLAIVRGILDEAEGQRYQELWNQSIEAMLDDRWEESELLQAEAEALGRFVPLLDGPRAPEQGIYIVPNQMADDQRRFLALTHTYLKYLGEAPHNTR